MSPSIFSDKFLAQLTMCLAERTKEGYCVTRKVVCEDLDIDSAYEGAIGAIIRFKIISGYQIHMGPTGGIGLEGVKPPKRSKVAVASSFPTGFLNGLRNTLDTLCKLSIKPVPRRVVAEKMGMPGSATENMISAALKLKDFNRRYGVKNGRYGGVILLDILNDVLGLDAPLISTTDAFEPTIPSIIVNASLQTEVVSTAGVL